MSNCAPILESAFPNAKISRLLELAAEQRASGVGWKAIAESTQRSMTIWEQWLIVYRDVWDRMLRAAEARAFRDAGAEALQVLRTLLRSKDEKIRRDVGRTLATLMYRFPTQTAPGSDRPLAIEHLAEVFQHVESLTDEQVLHLAELPAHCPAFEADYRTIVDARPSGTS